MTSKITLDGFVAGEQHELARVILGVAGCGVEIQTRIGTSALTKIVGITEDVNARGERQIPMDQISNEIFKRRMSHSTVGYYLCEEESEVLTMQPDGPYCLAVDPLDGSAQLEEGGVVGTIFGVHHRGRRAKDDVFLQPGSRLAAAGLILYGSQTKLVWSSGKGVNIFVLDPDSKEWLLARERMMLPEETSKVTYSTNEANQPYWRREEVRKFVSNLKRSHYGPASLRYCGTLVGDGFRTLLKGGLFLYPEDGTNRSGKLSVAYELAPFAFLMEQAGGRAITTHGRRILDIVPGSIHERSPVVMGSSSLVATYLKETCGVYA